MGIETDPFAQPSADSGVGRSDEPAGLVSPQTAPLLEEEEVVDDPLARLDDAAQRAAALDRNTTGTAQTLHDAAATVVSGFEYPPLAEHDRVQLARDGERDETFHKNSPSAAHQWGNVLA